MLIPMFHINPNTPSMPTHRPNIMVVSKTPVGHVIFLLLLNV